MISPSTARLRKRIALVATASAVAACAGARPAEQQATPRASASSPSPPDAGADALLAPGEQVPSLDALAARGPAEMPLMREALRVADATKPIVLEARTTDTCFRAVVAASAPVRAWFEDDAHAMRGADLSATSGLVPPRGPACARKGETLRLIVEPASAARAVVWQAP